MCVSKLLGRTVKGVKNNLMLLNDRQHDIQHTPENH
jgi:hypothetical protein